MRYLLDGDVANNNGNWQWISSVGVDPAPLHRRLYNPTLQQQRHDPDGAYVRPLARRRLSTSSRSSTTPSSAGARLPHTAGRAARKLRLDGELHPRAARAVHAGIRRALHRGLAAGPGRGRDDHVRLASSSTTGAGRRPSSCARRTSVVHGSVEADNEERAIAQAARIVSLDHDGTGYAEVGERDPIVGELQSAPATCAPCSSTRRTRRRRGRSSPPARATRRPSSSATRSRATASSRHRRSCSRLRAQLGLPEAKLPRLHAVAEAALEGRLDREPLLAADPADALAQLQELPGIGPFYAGLILLRAVGTTDVLAAGEPRLKKAVRAALRQAAGGRRRAWRPFRTWVSVLDPGERMTLSSTSSATSRPGPAAAPDRRAHAPRRPRGELLVPRHLVVYEWIANRVHGRRVVDLASGEGYGAAVLARTAHSVDRRRRQPRGVRARRRQVPTGHLRTQHGRAVAGRRGLRRVPADDRAHPGPGRDARPRPAPGRARRRRLRLDAQRAHARAEGRRALRQPVARARVQAGRVPGSCASAISAASTCSGSSMPASCARTSWRCGPGGTASTPRPTSRSRSTTASHPRSRP